MPARSKRPETVRVLGKDYRIEVQPSGKIEHDQYGQVQFSNQTITLAEGCHPQQEREVTCHEIFHCIEKAMGWNFEEAIVVALGECWYQVLRDNPELVRWLMSEGR